MDNLRAGVVWAIWFLILGLAAYIVWTSRMVLGWRKVGLRVAGTLLAIVFVCASLIFGIGVLMGADPPREHRAFISATGRRVALLSHSSLRDSAATRVSVKQGCCRRLIVYDYFGDGDDYMEGRSVQWVDDYHLAVRFAVDPTGQQTCHPYVGDVIVSCEPHPDPTARPTP